MPEQKMTPEDVFRDGLKAAVEINRKLGPYFDGFESLAEAAELAQTNDGQLKMLMKLVIGK